MTTPPRSSIALTLALALLGTGAAALAQPANDACTAAQTISIGTVTGNNSGATPDIAESSCSFNDFRDVWYSFTAPSAGMYTIDTIGSTGLTDTSLAVYNQCAATGRVELACNDDIDAGANNFLSRLMVSLSAGQTVKIRVSGYDGAFGVFNLSVRAPCAPPANDNCTSAAPIGPGASVSGTTCGATSTLPASGCALQPTDDLDVWYALTTTTAGYYRIDTNGSTDLTDTTLAIYSSCGGAALACDDDGGDGLLSLLNVSLAASTTYRVRVAGFGHATGTFILNISQPVQPGPVPPNDTCAAATVVTALPFTDTRDISGATADADVTTCNDPTATNVQQGVWYRYTPAATQAVRIRLTGPEGVFFSVLTNTGGCGGSFADLAGGCGTDAILTLNAATAYFILVGTSDATPLPPPVSMSLNIDRWVAPSNDTCAAARVVVGSINEQVDTTLAGNEHAEPAGTCNNPVATGLDNSVWYTFVPTVSGMLSGSVNSLFANYDIIAVLYTGPCGGLVQAACFDRGRVNPLDLSGPDQGTAMLAAGTRYYLGIGDWGTTPGGGDTQVSISLPGGAVGDGACCAGTTCVVSTQAACAGPNTSFAGPGTLCNAAGNTTTPCCKADFNHVGGVTIQDIFDFLAAYFTQNAQADINGADGVTVQDIFDFLRAYFAGC